MQESQQNDKLYYTIGEVSKKFDVNVSTVRFWENEFSILKPKKNNKGNRLFTKEDLKNLEIIHFLLKVQGLTLKGAKKKLSENKEGVERNAEIVASLTKVKEKLEAISSNLNKDEE